MQNYKCKFCGAELYWNTDEGCLKCNYCESTYQPSDFDDATQSEVIITEKPVEPIYTAASETEQMVVYECKTCGGEVVAMETTMATICPYCGEAISITSKSAGEFRPQLLIPFEKSKELIVQSYKDYVNRSLLTPRKFKKEHTIEKIQGLFSPFNLHTVVEHSKHRFSAETTSSSRRGDDKITHHRVYDLAIIADGKFKRIPTDGVKTLDNALMDSLEPFEYSALTPYNPAFMAGFLAEQIDEDDEKMSVRAEARSKNGMTEKARAAFRGYQDLRLINEEHEVKEHIKEYVMLPVWLLNVKHGDENYQFAVNGQTGKVVGKLPMDIKKLILILLGAFVASDIIIGTIIGMVSLF